ncbi:MAG: hypothetical protein M0Z95_17865 [Actinomycetota bacterium]|jgi:hypothetical protein|nr:hypothetical protein [Actinomycetota bacterium]
MLRAWLLAHLPLNSDEAVVGLMARGYLSGHLGTFYWGQQYGGAESYVVAAVLRTVNGGPMGLNGTAALISTISAVVVAAIVHEATRNPRLAAVSGAVAWVWSYAGIWNSVRENGFRQLAVCCGLVLVLCALRLHRPRPTAATYAVLGLSAGLGWWASPEIAYFAAPVGIIVVTSWSRLSDKGTRWSRRIGWRPALLTLSGVVVGALPWLYTNIHTGFASLRTSSLPSTPGQGYGYRLMVFFHEMLPIQLGTRVVPGGAWVGGDTVGEVLFGVLAALIAVAIVRCVWAARTGYRAIPMAGLAAGIVAFPFIYSAIPSSGYWIDGRYGVYLPPLLAAFLALSLAGPVFDSRSLHESGWADALAAAGRIHRASGAPVRRALQERIVVPVAAVALAGALVLTMAGASTAGIPATPRSFLSHWTDPNAAGRQSAHAMASHHIRYAYGDYWIAYTLDFLDPGQVTVSPSPLDVVRWPAMAAKVARAPDPAWLFFAPTKIPQASAAFSNPETGPGGYTQAQFEAFLRSRAVPYRVVALGVLDAVVPARKVSLPKPTG